MMPAPNKAPAIVPLNGNAKVSGRELRRRLNQESAYLGSQIGPAVNQLLHNDQITQQKITALETWKDGQPRTFWQRLRWLFTGA